MLTLHDTPEAASLAQAVEMHRADARGDGTPLLLYDLLLDLETLGARLLEQIDRQAYLDAFLLAAGMNQVVEDALHPDPLFANRVARALRARGERPARIAADLLAASGQAVVTIRSGAPALARLSAWQRSHERLVDRLADAVVGAAGAAESDARLAGHERLAEEARLLVAGIQRLPPAVRRTVNRPPSCFLNFDQQPADLVALAARFAARRPVRDRPVAVVGIRTSGSYLAPLVGASLRARGYQQVTVLTARPARSWLPHERAAIQAISREGGVFVLTDDPPVSGGSIAEVAAALERAGADRSSIVPLVPVFEEAADLPARLRAYDGIALPYPDWAIHARFEPAAVAASLQGLVGPALQVASAEPVEVFAGRSARGHRRARFRVRLCERGTERTWTEDVLAEGCGVGYFGRHALAVGRALVGATPATYGVEDGLLLRAWAPAEHAVRLDEPGGVERLAEGIVEYVVTRRRALAVRRDPTPGLIGQSPAWEVASKHLARVFGRGWFVARAPAVNPIVKAVLQASQPAVVDGKMGPERWFSDPGGGRLLKVDVASGAFRNGVELTSYDPVFDLASAVAELDVTGRHPADEMAAVATLLRDRYADRTGERPDAGRWLLYQLTRLLDLEARAVHERLAVRRACARAVQRYVAEVLLAGVAPAERGPLCALDLDGVLETAPLGFPILTPGGARALRALICHGLRPILVTGRSLGEVRERCAAYQLIGGVAEYGSVAYVRQTGTVLDVLDPRERAALERLRAALRDLPGIQLDPGFEHAIRAFRVAPTGRRLGLDAETVGAALQRSNTLGYVRSIAGDDQTDFVSARIDKAVGVQALLAALNERAPGATGRPLAFAVGDTAEDRPMLVLAERAFAPAHAREALQGDGITIVERPYQAGLVEAATSLLGHAPGACGRCREPAIQGDARPLHTLLGAPENGSRGLVAAAVSLSVTSFLKVVWITLEDVVVHVPFLR